VEPTRAKEKGKATEDLAENITRGNMAAGETRGEIKQLGKKLTGL
jgi:hypothetical protein